MSANGLRHFLDLSDFATPTLRAMLDAGCAMKARRRTAEAADDRPLAGKVVAMVFEQPSLRTRMSFDVGIRELGGESVMVTGKEIELGEREAIADTARVLSRFVDAIMIRMLNHDQLAELARHATVPVINGLTKRSHPCQVMADLMTFEERKGPIAGRRVAWTGDFNNVLASWIHAAARFDFELAIATPPELAPREDLIRWAKDEGARLDLGHRAEAAVEGADAVISDSWVSMGDADGERRHNLLKPFQVNAALMKRAAPDAIFLHCLPAHRGEEVTDEVIDGPQSAVFDEAENRLHAQKGVLAWCFGAVGQ
ncbi:ornithine carbamoyltransferase [Hansschlegelia zhihuaiae]|uniref:Ornithine carbamoyltransferase n=1 Tax=Hansschlegelia zhihuaiae TaxID=405005 RepID=A0A4Q0MH59_9HYPH|nr:ornithine carbamoyltransferase [Hansschlegelia zhihuaiae]RXF72754.1 ornithine carbamoyltransferase [Hansschlegelia zhihuaiae]